MATATGAQAANISEQFVREAPDIEAYKLSLMQSAQALPKPTLPDYKIAGMTNQQTEAIKQGQAGIGAYVPYLQGGAENVMGGAGAISEAADVLRGSDTRNQFQAAQNAQNTALQNTLDQSQPIGQQQIQQYMNPYTNLVVGQQLDEMNRQAMMQQQGLNAQAVKAGAFGGSRQGIAQQELNRNLMQTQNQAIAQAMQQNYGQGLSTAQQQQQMGLAAANQLGNLGQGIGSLAQQQYGIGQSMAQGLGSLGTSLGNMGVQQAALGQQAQALGQNDTNFLYNLGAQQQKQSQAVLDAERASTMQTALQDQQRLAFLSDIYKGAPSTQMSMTQQQTAAPSPFQQITGVGTGILGLAGAGKATGLI
jgi:hypothetical protein